MNIGQAGLQKYVLAFVTTYSLIVRKKYQLAWK